MSWPHSRGSHSICPKKINLPGEQVNKMLLSTTFQGRCTARNMVSSSTTMLKSLVKMRILKTALYAMRIVNNISHSSLCVQDFDNYLGEPRTHLEHYVKWKDPFHALRCKQYWLNGLDPIFVRSTINRWCGKYHTSCANLGTKVNSTKMLPLNAIPTYDYWTSRWVS